MMKGDRKEIYDLEFKFFFCSLILAGPITFHSGMELFIGKLSADVGHAYICTTSSTEFKLTSGNSTVNVSLSHIEFQPFKVHDGHLGERKCIILILFWN